MRVGLSGTGVAAKIIFTSEIASYPWKFSIYGSDPCLYAASNWGVLGHPSYPLYQIYSNAIWCNGVWLSSDERLKKNITDLDDCLNKIMKVKSVTYDFITEIPDTMAPEKRNEIEANSKNKIGFIAQDLKKTFPELVQYNSTTDCYSVDYIGMIPVLLESIKEQETIIEDQNKILNEQSQKVTNLEKEIETIKGILKNINNEN
jgi:hypothetical protein